MSFNNSQPFVSVITPVYNGELTIEKNIQSLLDQDYPKDNYEIIIIDNGSSDKTEKLAKKYPVILLQENQIQTSYAARNRGILKARGSIIAFTDADCVARPDWVSQGVRHLTEEEVDMIGGRVSFTFSPEKSPAELLDSIINLHNESSIAEKGSAKTANLFVKKELFRKVGMFRSDQKSGEDAGWTSRASHLGFKIAFGNNVVVEHPARKFSELLKKHFRVGMGSVGVWKSQGRNLLWIFARLVSLFTPLLAVRVPFLVKRRGVSDVRYPIIKMMGIAWMCTVATGWGIMRKFIE